MTIAKDSINGEIVHGHDLRGMNDLYIRTTTFECPYDKCRILATPCSYKETNLNQSYFRYKEDHKPGCEIHDPKNENKHKSKGDKKHNSPPALAISLLRLDVPERKSVTSRRGPDQRVRDDEKESEDKAHPVSSSSIKPVVDYYVNGDNRYELLSIPPYGVRSYKDTFQLIIYREGIRYNKPAIYFGKIQSNIRLERKSDCYYLTFLARKKGTKQAYKLEIDVSGWDESKKNFFYDEYEKQRREANDYYNGLKDKSKATKYLNVFFFGFPDEFDNFLFKTNRFKLIYIVFLNEFDATYNDTNYYIEKEPRIGYEINNEHLTVHQNKINLAE
ncbi:hypothetical protein, partial [Citrobacter portucalensis]|nr:hypothetical protein [Citrobacter portucalensis]MDV0585073.1 hypothetical protein [Citrobacter portucalensis]MEB0661576.1 hypothetical protein [Citrobacter portucalensis]MEB0701864.1 hypothetical protein [Citrobacter portucalensis]